MRGARRGVWCGDHGVLLACGGGRVERDRDAAFGQALEHWLGDDAAPRSEALHLLAAHGYDGLHGAIIRAAKPGEARAIPAAAAGCCGPDCCG